MGIMFVIQYGQTHETFFFKAKWHVELIFHVDSNQRTNSNLHRKPKDGKPYSFLSRFHLEEQS